MSIRIPRWTPARLVTVFLFLAGIVGVWLLTESWLAVLCAVVASIRVEGRGRTERW